MNCRYCHKPCEWVENKEVYNGTNYGHSYMIWLCRPCDAYIGCHNNTKAPLGLLAKKELRELRIEVKNYFIDKYLGGDWNTATKDTKKKMYKKLSYVLHKKSGMTHFAKFEIKDLQKLKEVYKIGV